MNRPTLKNLDNIPSDALLKVIEYNGASYNCLKNNIKLTQWNNISLFKVIELPNIKQCGCKKYSYFTTICSFHTAIHTHN